jgi:hypothetical protein
MRLVGVVILKNEADILEAFVRHQLHYLDRLVVVDHASDDASAQILARLRDEGLPLDLHRLEDLAFDHARHMSAALRMAARTAPAEHYLALDADEFVRCASGDALRDALAAVPAGRVGQLRWQTQVPSADPAARDDPHVLHRLTRRIAHEPRVQHKVVLPRELVLRDDWRIATGNHWVHRVVDGTLSERLPGLDLDGVRLAHLPLRSPSQLVRKVVLGWFGHRLALGRAARQLPLNWHWHALFRRIVAGTPPTWDDLPALAAEAYSSELPEPVHGPPVLVDDPLPVHGEQRWPELAVVDPLLDLVRWTDRLVEAATR